MLVVDDNATNREIVEAYLGAPGVDDRDRGAPGPTALTAMHAAARAGEPFELVVLDGQMPGMDGIELAQAISLAPSLRDCAPAHAHLDDRPPRGGARGRASHHYLQKPVRRARLLEAVAEAMGDRRRAEPRRGRARRPPPERRTRCWSSRTTPSTSA